jgi:tRNA A-37 threonylcarbamoyl transferase component Bud32
MLARHTILHELGRGTASAVYAARDRTTGAVVALKRLDPALLKSDPALAARFLERARAARRLRHPNIVEVLDASEAAGTAYVAMEMVEGGSLRALLDAGPLPVARAIHIAREIAAGLAYAHLEGAIHAGLTASNVLVSPSGRVKIADFGMGQAPVSPEQRRGEPVDHRCDIYALGALFYEMLTRQRPVEGEPPPPSTLNPNVPRALDAIVLGMLAAQPADRMAGVPILLRELQQLDEGLGLGSATPRVPKEEPVTRAAPREPEPRAPDPSFEIPPDLHRKIMEREAERQQPPSRSRPALFAALALLLTGLGIGVSYFNVIDLADVKRLASFIDQRPARAPAVAQPPAPAPVAEAPAEPPAEPVPEKPAVAKREPVAKPEPVARAEAPVASAPERPAPVVAAPTPPLPPAVPPPPPIAEAPPVAPPIVEVPAKRAEVPVKQAAAPLKQAEGMAKLVLAVSPGGELYINGEHYGTTPPLTTFELEPGMHRIEVRSGSRKPFLTYMTVEPGDVRRIRHDFNARPLRPPG